MSGVLVRPVDAGDRAAWQALFRGYRDFYEKAHDERIFDTVWGWLQDPASEVRCLLAVKDGEPVGLAHYRTFARPINGCTAIYLDDLFTAPAARGCGAASALLAELARIAAAEGAELVRWITHQDNATARSLYDQLASAGQWVTYDMKPAEE